MIKRTFILIFAILVVLGGCNLVVEYRKRNTSVRTTDTKAPQTKITLIEGWDNLDIANYLEKNKITTKAEFLAAQKNFDISDYSILKDKPKSIDLEGFIFPDTYFIPQTAPSGTNISNIILSRTLDNFEAKITPEILAGAKAHGLNLTELITLASIIERESRRDETEKRTIAGIFYNRLKIGMALQSDATVNYITHKGNPTPSLEELAVDSPYNTYKYAGLPPGPISNPGLDSIKAAANPIDSNYFYFLHADGTGKAIYAETHDEHVANKQKYLK